MYHVHDQTFTVNFLIKESLCRSIEYVANDKNPFSYSQHNNAYSINYGVLLGELSWMGTLFICTRNLLLELQLDMEWNNMLGMANKMEHQTSRSMFNLHDPIASLLCWNMFPCRHI